MLTFHGGVSSGVAFSPRYSTIYTMFPVFSLVLDKDVKSEVAMLYPELYKDLLKVHQLPSPGPAAVCVTDAPCLIGSHLIWWLWAGRRGSLFFFLKK